MPRNGSGTSSRTSATIISTAPDELAAWVPRLRELDAAAARTLVFMNNHYGAKAVTNARQLKELLAVS